MKAPSKTIKPTNIGGKPAVQQQRDERLLDGSPLHLHMCQLYLYIGSSIRDIMYSMYVMQKLSCVSYLDGFPVGAGLPELYVL
jgi:hypothetical protein